MSEVGDAAEYAPESRTSKRRNELPVTRALMQISILRTWPLARFLRNFPPMKVPILLLCSAFALSNAQAEILSDSDREALIENLDKLKEAAESRIDARFRVALAAFRNALGNDEAAKELYLNCVEKVNFNDQQKSAGDFREWKRKEGEKISDPGLKLALRYQLSWLVLTLQAASEKPDRAKLANDAQSIVDSIFRDPEKLRHQEALLSQPVTSSVFARAYDINSVKVEKWSLSPVQLDQIYTDILLPSFRQPDRLADLRAAWIKRIQQEGAKAEFWSTKPRENKNEEKRVGMASAMRPPEYEKFIEETLPKLQWAMEVDLFNHGDQKGAAIRMLAHMEKYVAHPSVREWGQEFRTLLAPASQQAPATGAEPTP
jgi:hypothetical protein